MFLVQNLTNNPKQKQTLVMPDGTQIFISIEYVPMQIGWFINELTYQSFTIAGVRIVNSPDILYQYRNQIPFGLACFTPGLNREPTQQEDFASDAARLYILSQDEVQAYTEFLSGG